MKLKYSSNIEKSDRILIAQLISNLLRWPDNQTDVPYMPNPDDTTFWTVDYGNYWKLKFFDDEPNIIEIYHRYRNSNLDKVAKLSEWLEARFGFEIID